MAIKNKIQIFKNLASKIIILSMLLIFITPKLVTAAAITSAQDVLSTNKVGELANHTITFTTPTGVAALETITVTFPADWSMGSVAFGDIDVTDDAGELTLDGAAAGATWGATIAGQVLTITSDSGTIDAGSVIVIEIGTNATEGGAGANQITNHATAGSYVIAIGGTQVDSGSIAVSLVTDPQVDVSANVNQSLTLALSATSLNFGTLTASAAGTGTMTLTVDTNSPNGYNLSYQATALTHTNTVDTITAYANAASSPGTEGWGINLKDNATPDIGAEPSSVAGGGTPTPAADYGTADAYHIVTGSIDTALASSAGTADTNVYTVTYIANVNSLTEAGNYTSNIDYQVYAVF